MGYWSVSTAPMVYCCITTNDHHAFLAKLIETVFIR